MNVTMPWIAIVIVASKRRTSSQNRLALKPPLRATEPPARSIEYVIPVPAVWNIGSALMYRSLSSTYGRMKQFA